MGESPHSLKNEELRELEEAYVGAAETHSPQEIRQVLDAGLSPQSIIRGRSLVTWLTEMYYRSDAFTECLRMVLERGAPMEDPVLAPVLLNDAEGIKQAFRANPALIGYRTSLVCAFTPLIGATLLHVAAEYGNAHAVRTLLELGADANATAAVDDYGFNGHTPLFHTVNSNNNRSEPIMRMLLEAGSSVDIRLPGITWGKGFEWETNCYDVTPISYAQLGLLRQFQRTEKHIYHNIECLLRAAGKTAPPLVNVPNRYLYPV